MVTIKQIAELCGVSRGTVDRVLNKRGNVKPEKEKLIVEMAKKLNYHPNPAGKALAARKKHPVLGVLIASEGVQFFRFLKTRLKVESELKPDCIATSVIEMSGVISSVSACSMRLRVR